MDDETITKPEVCFMGFKPSHKLGKKRKMQRNAWGDLGNPKDFYGRRFGPLDILKMDEMVQTIIFRVKFGAFKIRLGRRTKAKMCI
jgi:hypothetical protein